MSRMLTISFAESAFAQVRRLAHIGRPVEARKKLAAVLSSEELTATVADEAHRLAATLATDCDDFASARRHLRVLLRTTPDDAGLRYELGLAFENDPFGCDTRAARQFRRAARLSPTNAVYAAALGRALVRAGRVKAGVRHLTHAARTAAADCRVLDVVLSGLIEAGRPVLARKLIAEIRFTNPHLTGLDRLHDQARFAVARARQDRTGGRLGPATIPFVRVLATTGTDDRGVIVRRDTGTVGGPHFGRVRAYRAGQG